MVNFEFSQAFSAKVPADPSSREDNHFVIPERNIFAVLDGMGGIGIDAQYSSRLVKEKLVARFEAIDEEMAQFDSFDFLRTELETLNNEIIAEAQESGHTIGTTLALVHVFEKNGQKMVEYWIVGDSPISILQKNGKRFEPVCLVDNAVLHQFIRDHKISVEDAGKIENYEVGKPLGFELPNNISEKEILEFYFRERHYLDNCFGSDQFHVHYRQLEIDEGDIILIESDGTSDVLTLEERTEIFQNISFDQSAQAIVDGALQKQADIDAGKIESVRGKYCDDKTVVVVSV